MKVYRVTLMIVDTDQIGAGEIRSVIENVSYPNHCINPRITGIEERTVDDWSDSHPLNRRVLPPGIFDQLFEVFGSNQEKTVCLAYAIQMLEDHKAAHPVSGGYDCALLWLKKLAGRELTEDEFNLLTSVVPHQYLQRETVKIKKESDGTR